MTAFQKQHVSDIIYHETNTRLLEFVKQKPPCFLYLPRSDALQSRHYTLFLFETSSFVSLNTCHTWISRVKEFSVIDVAVILKAKQELCFQELLKTFMHGITCERRCPSSQAWSHVCPLQSWTHYQVPWVWSITGFYYILGLLIYTLQLTFYSGHTENFDMKTGWGREN
jgi:hypothetical protein